MDATQSEFAKDEHQMRYHDLPSFLRSVYDKVVEEDIKLLIVDSWDAVSSQIGVDKNVKLESSMLDIARKTKTNLIMVEEKSGVKTLDYLVDAIFDLEQVNIDEKYIRRVHIKKLRGIGLKQYVYPFTLDGGTFHNFPPYEWGKNT